MSSSSFVVEGEFMFAGDERCVSCDIRDSSVLHMDESIDMFVGLESL